MRIGFLIVRRVPPVPSPILVEACEILRGRGFDIRGIIAEEVLLSPDDLTNDVDLVVLKSHTELSLSLAGILDAAGARMLNPYPSCVATQDKLIAARRLRSAGVPTPRSWMTGDLSLLSSLVEDLPLIVKPHRGHRGAGLVIVDGPAALKAMPTPSGPMIVQEYIRGSGEDVKLYVVGERVFAVRKPFSETSFTQPGNPEPVSEELHGMALAAGRVLGLGLYGLDVIEGERGPMVVDVNYFPGYKGVPNVAPLIADYLEGYARGRYQLTLPELTDATSPAVPPDRPGPELPGARVAHPVAEPAQGHRGEPTPSGLNSALIAIIAEGFLSRLAFGLITFALPLYAFRQFGLGLAEVGMLLSLNLVVAIGLKPFTGRLADRIGMRRTLLGAIALRSAVPLSLALAATPWQLYAIRATHGASMALRDPAASVVVAERGGKHAVATAFAWYQTAKTVAGALGKAVAGIMLTLTGGFVAVFVLAFVLSVLPLIVVWRWIGRHGDPESVVEEVDAAPDPSAEPVRVAPFIGLGFLISATAYMLANLFPIFATEYAGLTEAQAGLILLAAAVVSLTGPAFGWLSDHVSRRLVLSVRSVANVVSSVVYLVAPNFAGALIGRAVDDAGKAAFRPAWGALMAHLAGFDRRRRARTFGSISSGEDAGEIAGPVLAGLLWTAWGVPALLAVRVVLAIVTELYALVLVRSLERGSPLASPTPPSDDGRSGHVTSVSAGRPARRRVGQMPPS